MGTYQGRPVDVKPADDIWWAERPPDLEGASRAEALAEQTAKLWLMTGVGLEHAALLAISLLLSSDPDELPRGRALDSVVDAAKAAARAANPHFEGTP